MLLSYDVLIFYVVSWALCYCVRTIRNFWESIVGQSEYSL